MCVVVMVVFVEKLQLQQRGLVASYHTFRERPRQAQPWRTDLAPDREGAVNLSDTSPQATLPYVRVAWNSLETGEQEPGDCQDHLSRYH